MAEPEQHNDDFNLLEDYLQRLHGGERPDRAMLKRDHPDLASALDCLEVLDGLAPPRDSAQSEADDTLSFSPNSANMPRDFGAYELLGEIGRGGMGVVYKARQKALDRSVAIKMILPGHLASPEHVRRFQTEAKAAARLQHSNIVHIHEVGELDGQHFFAMEYVEGVSLAGRIEQGPVDIQDAVRWVATIARAVARLHQQEIVHRDLKPSNILLDHEEQPFVTDFGLARVFVPGSEATTTGVIAGTPSYMSPEQASGRRASVGPASDIYSLGAILYELLTGRPPFREENPLDTLMQVLSREPALPRRLNPRIPRRLELICLKCLAKSPEERYASADALAEDLERFSRGEALEARPPHLGQRLWRWGWRQPALASRLGALGVFYLVELVNYNIRTVDSAFHMKISLIVAIWAIASIILQQFLDSQKWSIPARFGWGLLDSISLLAVLLVADGAASPLVVGYPLLIVGSGLWFRTRFVWFMTALSLTSYGLLVVDFYQRRPELQAGFDTSVDRHVIFAVSLVVLAAAVAYLVQRVRALSSYYGQQP